MTAEVIVVGNKELLVHLSPETYEDEVNLRTMVDNGKAINPVEVSGRIRKVTVIIQIKDFLPDN